MTDFKTHVLIVENSKLFRDLLTNLMKSNQLNVSCCSDGHEALKITQEHSFNLICIAYHLPDMSGEVLCHQLRGNPSLKGVRIILFTAEDDDSLLKGALLAGATDLYSKHDFNHFATYIKRFADSIHQSLLGTVLLVEDSISQLNWLKTCLESYGLDVHAFPDAEQAFKSIEDNQYDIVVTDMVLAGKMSGLNLVRAIRRLPNDKGLTPIFAITSYDEASRRIELFQVGVNDYMAKPLNPEEMRIRISCLIRSNQLFYELATERNLLKEIALLDPMTNLYNRNALSQLLPKAIANARRDQVPISLAVMDIDHFKTINDKHGHSHGDRILAEIGAWLRKIFRKGDLVFRWGGEEFVIFLHNCHQLDAQSLVEKQRTRLNERKFANLSITASFGISTLSDFQQEISMDTLLDKADQALYQAKSTGRNKVSCAD